jgi:hypothetical protein
VIAPAWRPRPVPLAPRAALGRGPVGERLAGVAGARAGLELVRFPDAVLVLGPEAELPWVDGVEYLGIDPRAPSLLVPTHRAPTVPIDLLARALIEGRGLVPPIAIAGELVLALGGEGRA